jgi:hypothetical protein
VCACKCASIGWWWVVAGWLVQQYKVAMVSSAFQQPCFSSTPERVRISKLKTRNFVRRGTTLPRCHVATAQLPSCRSCQPQCQPRCHPQLLQQAATTPVQACSWPLLVACSVDCLNASLADWLILKGGEFVCLVCELVAGVIGLQFSAGCVAVRAKYWRAPLKPIHCRVGQVQASGECNREHELVVDASWRH